MPSNDSKHGTFDTSIRAWMVAMEKAKKIKSGGKLVFINKKTGKVVAGLPPDSQQQ